jgi:hypothetical protein
MQKKTTLNTSFFHQFKKELMLVLRDLFESKEKRDFERLKNFLTD